jgi:hypothetical protein
MVRAYHSIMCQSMLSTWSVYFSIYCPRGQSVSHVMPTLSECLTIWCINRCCLHGQYVSVYIAHVVRVYPMWCPYGQSVSHIMPMWSECLTIYCSCGQSVSPYIAHVVSVSHHIAPMWSERIYLCCLHSQYILPTWSECIPHNAHVVRVSHNMMYQSMLSTFTECLT